MRQKIDADYGLGYVGNDEPPGIRTSQSEVESQRYNAVGYNVRCTEFIRVDLWRGPRTIVRRKTQRSPPVSTRNRILESRSVTNSRIDVGPRSLVTISDRPGRFPT